jgi:hypothetical protein
VKLTYKQLRDILGLIIKAQSGDITIEELISGATLKSSLKNVLEAVHASNIDGEIIKILTGKKVEDISDIEGIGIITDFFSHIKNSLLPVLNSRKSLPSSVGPKQTTLGSGSREH